MKFCKYCGRRLEDGELCSCTEFSRTHVQPPRPAPPPPPPKPQPGSWDDPYGHYKRSLFRPMAEAGPRGVIMPALFIFMFYKLYLPENSAKPSATCPYTI